MTVADYSLVIVNMHGVPSGELVDITPSSVSWELNNFGEMTFDIPTNHPQAALCMAIQSEVQLWRYGDTKPLWWGVLVNKSSSNGKNTWTCKEIPWYLSMRVVGKAGRTNLIQNGGFEDGPVVGNAVPHWATVNTTIARTPNWKFLDTYGLDLYQSQGLQNAYITQRVTLPATQTFYDCSAWVHIRDDAGNPDPFGGAFAGLGMLVSILRTDGTVVAQAGVPLSAGNGNVKGKSYRLEVGVSSPPGFAGGYLDLNLYSPHGHVVWDAVQCVAMESLSYHQVDQADILAGLVAHAQDPAMNKSDLNIGMNVARPSYTADASPPHVGEVVPGNLNLANRPVVHNSDGSISTVAPIVYQDGSLYVVIPKVIGPTVQPDDVAIAWYLGTGSHLGKFDTSANANTYLYSLVVAQNAFYNTSNTVKTGVVRDVTYQFVDHQNILQEMQNLSNAANGLDFHFEYTATNRVCTIDFPRKGDVHNEIAFEYYESGGGNLVSYTYAINGTDCRTGIITTSQAEGPTREEAGVHNADYVGGVILEEVVSLNITDISLLFPIALMTLAKKMVPPGVLEVTTQEGAYALVGSMDVGDTVRVKIQDGDVNLIGQFRAVGINLNPQTEEMKITFNDYAPSTVVPPESF